MPTLINKVRFSGRTAYGAIGTCLSGFVWRLGHSTNIKEYIEFLRVLEHESRHTAGTRPWVIFDGQAVHRSRKALDVLQGWARPLLLPKASCLFNP